MSEKSVVFEHHLNMSYISAPVVDPDLQPSLSRLDLPRTLVLLDCDSKSIVFDRQNGSVDEVPYPKVEDAWRAHDALSCIGMKFDTQATTLAGRELQAIGSTVAVLKRPRSIVPDLIEYKTVDANDWRSKLTEVRLGALSMASKIPASGETDHPLRELLQQDVCKANLAFYDHMMVEAQKHSFYVPFDTPAAFVIARVLEIMSYKPMLSTTRDSIDSTAERVWESMSAAERRYFIKHDSELLKTKDFPVRDLVEDAIKLLRTGMGFRTNGKAIAADGMRVHYSREPYQVVPGAAMPEVVASPGMSIGELGCFRPVEPTEHELNMADVIITMTDTTEKVSLTVDQAREHLHFVLSRNGKRAMQARLQDTTGMSLEKILGMAHRNLESRLGFFGYNNACLERGVNTRYESLSERRQRAASKLADPPRRARYSIATRAH